jgi:chromosome segregation ATPase
VKKHQDLSNEAQKIRAANLKVVEEQRKIAAQRQELEKQRESLKAAQRPVEVAAK